MEHNVGKRSLNCWFVNNLRVNKKMTIKSKDFESNKTLNSINYHLFDLSLKELEETPFKQNFSSF